MIPQELIEKALALTGKTMEDMKEYIIPKWKPYDYWRYEFSYPKFCYYLLSEKFIEKYTSPLWTSIPWTTSLIAKAIYEYQSWNEQPLIDLLSKI